MQPNAFGMHEQLYGIYDFKESVQTEQWTDDVDDWEPNDV